MAAMFGWFSEASTSASRWKRARRSASVAKDRAELDRDLALQLRIRGATHLAHAAHTDLGDDFIGAEAGAGCQRHGDGSEPPRLYGVPDVQRFLLLAIRR